MGLDKLWLKVGAPGAHLSSFLGWACYGAITEPDKDTVTDFDWLKMPDVKFLQKDWIYIPPVDLRILGHTLPSNVFKEDPSGATLALVDCMRSSAQDTLNALARRGWKIVRV